MVLGSLLKMNPYQRQACKYLPLSDKWIVSSTKIILPSLFLFHAKRPTRAPASSGRSGGSSFFANFLSYGLYE